MDFWATISSMLVYFYRLSVKIMGVITLVRICFVSSFFLFIIFHLFLCVKSAFVSRFVYIDFMASGRNRYGFYALFILIEDWSTPKGNKSAVVWQYKYKKENEEIISVYRPPKILFNICCLAPFLLSPILLFYHFCWNLEGIYL